MKRFELPLVGHEISVKGALAMMRRDGCWGLVLHSRAGGYGIVDFRDLIEETDPSRLVNDVDSEVVLGPQDVPQPHPDPNDILGGERLRDAVTAKSHRFVLLGVFLNPGGQTLARLFSVSELHADRFLGGTPGKRCNRPNRPAGTPTRQWYHYYPATAGGTCSIDGSPIT